MRWRTGGLEDLGGALHALAHAAPVEVRKRVVDHRLTVLADLDLATVAIAQQHADRRRVGERLEQAGVLGAAAPGRKADQQAGVGGGGLVLDAVGPLEEAFLVGVDRLHGALPGTHLLVEHAPHDRGGMQLQVLADVRVVEAGALQQHRRVDRSAGRDDGAGVDGAARGRRSCAPRRRSRGRSRSARDRRRCRPGSWRRSCSHRRARFSRSIAWRRGGSRSRSSRSSLPGRSCARCAASSPCASPARPGPSASAFRARTECCAPG